MGDFVGEFVAESPIVGVKDGVDDMDGVKETVDDVVGVKDTVDENDGVSEGDGVPEYVPFQTEVALVLSVSVRFASGAHCLEPYASAISIGRKRVPKNPRYQDKNTIASAYVGTFFDA